MQREKVNSSSVASVGYDADHQTLEIEYKNGKVYQYFGVPEYLYEEIFKTQSIGSFVNYYIKEQGFDYMEVS